MENADLNPRPVKKQAVLDLTDGVGLTQTEADLRARRDVTVLGLEDDDEDEVKDLPPLFAGLRTLEDMPKAEQPARMRSKLFPFQLQGLAWMTERDKEGGGILADEMGLGKTLQAIALICTVLPTKEQRRRGEFQTLVVCPLSCLQQWYDELKLHAPELTVLQFYGSARRKSAASLAAYDVLLTTYGTVQSTMLANGEPNRTTPMSQIRFFRIILDEAHTIRNPHSKTHKASLLLHSERRWCLTGTPMQNSAKDVGALLRFLGLNEPLHSWSSFKKMCEGVDKGQPYECSKLQNVLRPLLLRRTKRTEIGGKPIFEVPPVTIVQNELPFEEAEATLYQAVATKYAVAFERFDRDGELAAKQASIFALILRLRQLCLHPLLFVFGKMRTYKVNDQYVLKSRDKMNVRECMEYYDMVVKFLTEGAEFGDDGLNGDKMRMIEFILAADQNHNECSICMDEIDFKASGDNKAIKTKCKHLFHESCLKEWLEGHGTCPLCRSECSDLELLQVRVVEEVGDNVRLPASVAVWLTSIDHSFIKYKEVFVATGFDLPIFLPNLRPEDLLEEMHIPPVDARRMLEAVEKLKPIPNAAAALASSPFVAKTENRPLDNDNNAASNDNNAVVVSNNNALVVGDDGDLCVVEDDFFFDKQEEVPKSTKLTLLINTLDSMVTNDPETKILVFTQFTKFLDLVEDCLCRTDHLGSSFCRLDGTMKHADRVNQIESFRSDPNKKIFLLSLKVASLGLNLTAANRVILLDPWYNPSVEAQAMDRCVRFGQTRPVTVMRLFISSSIEDRLRQIQAGKQRATDMLLNEDSHKGVQLRNITVSNVAALRKLFQLPTNNAPLRSLRRN